jgi:acyl carrier protein
MSSLAALQALIEDKYGLDAATLDPHASMRAAGIDSLALVEFLFEVEDRLGVAVPDKHGNVDTLAQLAAVLDEAKAKAARKAA